MPPCADGGCFRSYLLSGVLLALTACGGSAPPEHLRVIGGEPRRGRELIMAYGCTACHRVPGVGTVSGSVGPPLAGLRDRAYIAGRVPNRPDRLTQWLRDPPAIDPQTAMPSLGLSEADARHIAAYLYSLR